MTDPVSITAAVAGLVMSALSASKSVYNEIQAIKKAPKAVSDLEIDVKELMDEIERIKGIGDSQWEKLGASTAVPTKAVLVSCEKTCKAFENDLKRWTKSSDGKLEAMSRMDQFKLGFYRQKEVESFRKQVQSCKLSLTKTISVANLYASIRIGTAGAEINKMLITNRKTAEDQNAELQRQIEAIGKTLTEFMVFDENPEPFDDDNDVRDREAAMSQIREERTAVLASQKLLQELTKSEQEIEARQPSITQTYTFGSNERGAQVGTNSGGISLTFDDHRSTATGVASEQSVVGALESKNTGKPPVVIQTPSVANTRV